MSVILSLILFANFYGSKIIINQLILPLNYTKRVIKLSQFLVMVCCTILFLSDSLISSEDNLITDCGVDDLHTIFVKKRLLFLRFSFFF